MKKSGKSTPTDIANLVTIARKYISETTPTTTCFFGCCEAIEIRLSMLCHYCCWPLLILLLRQKWGWASGSCQWCSTIPWRSISCRIVPNLPALFPAVPEPAVLAAAGLVQSACFARGLQIRVTTSLAMRSRGISWYEHFPKKQDLRIDVITNWRQNNWARDFWKTSRCP